MWWCRSPRDAREPPPGSGEGSRDESAGAARSGAELGHLACLEAGGAHVQTLAGAVDHGRSEERRVGKGCGRLRSAGIARKKHVKARSNHGYEHGLADSDEQT